jgi:hypothetical protein
MCKLAPGLYNAFEMDVARQPDPNQANYADLGLAMMIPGQSDDDIAMKSLEVKLSAPGS